MNLYIAQTFMNPVVPEIVILTTRRGLAMLIGNLNITY